MESVTAWRVATKGDRVGALLADGHYSRRAIGSPQFMPPGETFCLVTVDEAAVFGWWRPHPASGIKAMNGLDGWTCSIFRYVGGEHGTASTLILEAEHLLRERKGDCGPSGLLTYVWDVKVASPNPGYCFKCAHWQCHPTKPKSADGRKSLLWKPWEHAGF